MDRFLEKLLCKLTCVMRHKILSLVSVHLQREQNSCFKLTPHLKYVVMKLEIYLNRMAITFIEVYLHLINSLPPSLSLSLSLSFCVCVWVVVFFFWHCMECHNVLYTHGTLLHLVNYLWFDIFRGFVYLDLLCLAR